MMGTRIKFFGLAVFFAMVAFLGFALLSIGYSRYLRWWIVALSGVSFTLLSLVGVFAPQKMKWLMDAWKKNNGE